MDSSGGIKELSDTKYLEEVIKNAPSFDSFSSKMRLTINLDGKETSVNGSLKMKKNDLIQLSIAPILGIEVARIEISKDSVLVIDPHQQTICICTNIHPLISCQWGYEFLYASGIIL